MGGGRSRQGERGGGRESENLWAWVSRARSAPPGSPCAPQEPPRAQIAAYCSTAWAAAGADDSVSRCFENCAIEAVSSACQVSSATRCIQGPAASKVGGEVGGKG